MNKLLRRIRAAIGMGVTWAAAWVGAGMITQLGFVLFTGARANAPFPFIFGLFGFGAGVIFSGLLSVRAGNRRFKDMSIPRFAVWGATGGLLLSVIFIRAITEGTPAFVSSVRFLGPIFAIAGAASAAGSLAIARRAEYPELGGSRDDLAIDPAKPLT